MTMKKSGFTLVEIMIVVLIIGLLAAIAVPNFVKARKSTQSKACVDNMRQLEGAMEQAMMEGVATPTFTDIIGTDKYIKSTPHCPVTPTADYTLAPAATDGITVKCPNEGTYTDHKLRTATE